MVQTRRAFIQISIEVRSVTGGENSIRISANRDLSLCGKT